MPSSSGGRPPQAPPVVSTRGARFHLRSPNRALWASPSPPVGLRLGDLRGGPRLAAGPRLGGRTCPRQSQLASQLLNFPSRALRPPLRQHPCLSIRSAHTHPPLARGGRVVCLLCSPSQSYVLQPSYPHPHALSHGLRGLVLSQTPRRLGPRSRCLLLWPPPHTERPRCLASAATALLFLLPPHM